MATIVDNSRRMAAGENPWLAFVLEAKTNPTTYISLVCSDIVGIICGHLRIKHSIGRWPVSAAKHIVRATWPLNIKIHALPWLFDLCCRDDFKKLGRAVGKCGEWPMFEWFAGKLNLVHVSAFDIEIINCVRYGFSCSGQNALIHQCGLEYPTDNQTQTYILAGSIYSGNSDAFAIFTGPPFANYIDSRKMTYLLTNIARISAATSVSILDKVCSKWMCLSHRLRRTSIKSGNKACLELLLDRDGTAFDIIGMMQDIDRYARYELLERYTKIETNVGRFVLLVGYVLQHNLGAALAILLNSECVLDRLEEWACVAARHGSVDCLRVLHEASDGRLSAIVYDLLIGCRDSYSPDVFAYILRCMPNAGEPSAATERWYNLELAGSMEQILSSILACEPKLSQRLLYSCLLMQSVAISKQNVELIVMIDKYDVEFTPGHLLDAISAGNAVIIQCIFGNLVRHRVEFAKTVVDFMYQNRHLAVHIRPIVDAIIAMAIDDMQKVLLSDV